MEHVTFDRMPHALGLLLDRLEALRAEVAELRAAVSPPPKGGGGGPAGNGLMAFSEACAYLGVGRTTLSRWKREGMWEELKGATAITAQSIISNVYRKMHELTMADGDIKADALAKLARVVETISDKKYTVSQMFNVFRAFTDWLFPKDMEAAKTLNRYMREFVEEQVSK